MAIEKNILALDPANRTGWAHSGGQHGVWHLGTGASRLAVLDESILRVAGQWGVDLIAFEEASFGSHNHAVQAAHNELAGVIKLVAVELGVEIVAYNPMTIHKFATGNGRAKKPQMMRACKTILGIEPASDDEADALWILELAKQGYRPPEKPRAKRTSGRRRGSKRLF